MSPVVGHLVCIRTAPSVKLFVTAYDSLTAHGAIGALAAQRLPGPTQESPDNPLAMNPLLSHLQPYPFERLRQLFAGVTPNPAYRPISLGMGEPRHPTPAFIAQALVDGLPGLASYPLTAGEPRLRQACADWLQRRYAVAVDAASQVLPVNGSREALFAFAQTVIDPTQAGATVVCPNPFYQIYEGAAVLAGAQVHYAPSDAARNFAVDWDSVPTAVWERTQLLFVCSPGNPTGAVMPLAEWEKLFALSDRYGFVIASDECYSEIYFDEAAPPLGVLQAARALGRDDYRGIVMFSSLSKRSNVPGLRSGFVAGDAALLKKFWLYRTYQGCAMSPPVQHASAVAWNDEVHVRENRRLYREKFDAVTPLIAAHLGTARPDAGFYLWARTPIADTEFALGLQREYNVTVLPGSYLARTSGGINPGENFVRIALVAPLEECLEAARRMQDFCRKL